MNWENYVLKMQFNYNIRDSSLENHMSLWMAQRNQRLVFLLLVLKMLKYLETRTSSLKNLENAIFKLNVSWINVWIYFLFEVRALIEGKYIYTYTP